MFTLSQQLFEVRRLMDKTGTPLSEVLAIIEDELRYQDALSERLDERQREVNDAAALVGNSEWRHG